MIRRNTCRVGVRRFAIAIPFLAAFALLSDRPAAADMRDSSLEPWLGRYLMELRVASTARLPLMPADRTTTTSHLLVDIRRGPDGRLVQHHRVCAVQMANSSPMRTNVPATFLNALKARRYPVRLDAAGANWRYEADLGLDAIGFDPGATGGRLPESPDDPGVIDADGDGNPGATIEVRVPLVGTGRLFIAQQTHLVLRADARSPRRIEGQVEIRKLEQRTLGADPARFRRTPGISPDPGRSGFTMVRLPDGYGCSDIEGRVAKLLERERDVVVLGD